MNDLQQARTALAQDGYTCVLCHGSEILTDSRRGVKPLLELLESGSDYTGFSAADKVVGKAAAHLYCLLGISAIYAGCGKQVPEQTSQTTAIGNPWTDWDSLEEAESAVGFSFGLPEVIADSYQAVSIRTLNNELIEVTYRDESFEVCSGNRNALRVACTARGKNNIRNIVVVVSEFFKFFGRRNG